MVLYRYYINAGGKELQKRNINIEVLRVISMFMIVYHHFYVHSQFVGLIPLSKKTIILQSIGSFGKIGVLIFGLISGYYLANQTFKINRIFQLSNLIRFYTLISFISWMLVDKPVELIKENFLYSFFPIIFQRYWFVTAYVILLLFQPIIKHYLLNESRENQLKYFIFFLISFSVVEWIGVLFNAYGYFEPSEVFSFIIIALGGYLIKLYQKELHEKYLNVTIFIFLITLILILSKPFLLYYFRESFAFPTYFLIGMASLNATFFSMSIFVLILKIKIDKYSWITSISSLTFDIYLIHDNPFFRKLIWTVIFKNNMYINNTWFPLIILLEPLTVFVVSLIIGRIRLSIFNLADNFIREFRKKFKSKFSIEDINLIDK